MNESQVPGDEFTNVVNVTKVRDGEIYTFIGNDAVSLFEIHSCNIDEVYVQPTESSRTQKVDAKKGILPLIDLEKALKHRCITYSPKFHALFITLDYDRTVYKNGRTVKKSKYTSLDVIADDMHLTTDEKIVKRFALLPTKMGCGKMIWLKSYYSYFGTAWGSSLHSGWYWVSKIKADDFAVFLKVVAKARLSK